METTTNLLTKTSPLMDNLIEVTTATTATDMMTEEDLDPVQETETTEGTTLTDNRKHTLKTSVQEVKYHFY